MEEPVITPISLDPLDAAVQAAEALARKELEHAALLDPELAALLRQEDLTGSRTQSTAASGRTTVQDPQGTSAGTSTRASPPPSRTLDEQYRSISKSGDELQVASGSGS